MLTRDKKQETSHNYVQQLRRTQGDPGLLQAARI